MRLLGCRGDAIPIRDDIFDPKKADVRTAQDRATLESAEVQAREIAKLLDSAMPDGWGFVLVLSSLGEGEEGLVNYIANVDREGAVKVLQNILSRWKVGEMDDPNVGRTHIVPGRCRRCRRRVGILEGPSCDVCDDGRLIVQVDADGRCKVGGGV